MGDYQGAAFDEEFTGDWRRPLSAIEKDIMDNPDDWIEIWGMPAGAIFDRWFDDEDELNARTNTIEYEKIQSDYWAYC
jgi:hypothetical protein